MSDVARKLVFPYVLADRIPVKENLRYRQAERGTFSGGAAVETTYPPPFKGLYSGTPSGAPMLENARLLRNFWPTYNGITPRRGSNQLLRTGQPIDFAFTHGEQIYVADQGANTGRFRKVTSNGRNQDNIGDRATGSYTVSNDGGTFTLVVGNGFRPWSYDGSAWTRPKFTGDLNNAKSAKVDAIWGYSNRIFMGSSEHLTIYYLGINSIAGAASAFSLQGVFNRGGGLLFGTVWSSDSGAGFEDRCVFVTTNGEIAVYVGTNPASADEWSLQGVYFAGRPLGRYCHYALAGDIYIGTEYGLLSMNALVNSGLENVRGISLTGNIEEYLRAYVNVAPTDWVCDILLSENMLILTCIDKTANSNTNLVDEVLAMNLTTGAWTVFSGSGWNFTWIGVLNNRLIGCTLGGNVLELFVGGKDSNLLGGSAPIHCEYASMPSYFGDMKGDKLVTDLIVDWRLNSGEVSVAADVTADDTEPILTPPSLSNTVTPPVAITNWGSPWSTNTRKTFWTSRIGDVISFPGFHRREYPKQIRGKRLSARLAVSFEQDDPLDMELLQLTFVGIQRRGNVAP